MTPLGFGGKFVGLQSSAALIHNLWECAARSDNLSLDQAAVHWSDAGWFVTSTIVGGAMMDRSHYVTPPAPEGLLPRGQTPKVTLLPSSNYFANSATDEGQITELSWGESSPPAKVEQSRDQARDWL